MMIVSKLGSLVCPCKFAENPLTVPEIPVFIYLYRKLNVLRLLTILPKSNDISLHQNQYVKYIFGDEI